MPVIPRSTERFHVPPVCTAYWTPEDWARQMFVTWEPMEQDFMGDRWVAVGRNDKGEIVYQNRRDFDAVQG